MSSESEDFESADEGVQVESRERRKKKNRLPSSNDEDSGQESDTVEGLARQRNDRVAAKHGLDTDKQSEGWDDFEIDIDQPGAPMKPATPSEPSTSEAGPSGIPPKQNDDIKTPLINKKSSNCEESKDPQFNDSPVDSNGMEQESSISKVSADKPRQSNNEKKTKKAEEETGNDGWGNFDEEWEVESGGPGFSNAPPLNKPTIQQPGNQDNEPPATSVNSSVKLEEINPNASVAAPSNSGWGWSGWGVDSLLSSATAGITSITSHVSQVIESSIGAPDPEELAKMKPQDNAKPTTSSSTEVKPESAAESDTLNRGEGFPFGNLISGVSHITKFVENTGTKVLSGGLDTLETIGKKTMEVLQDGDPGLAKKKALLGLDADKPVLSAVLREARDRADEEDRAREQKREAKQVHYETLFDDFGGLVHLEALEMLSKQFQMQIDAKLMQLEGQKLQDLKETLQQVAELCELPDSDDEEENEELMDAESLRNKLEEATRDMGIGQQLNFDAVVSNLEECMLWICSCESGSGCLPRAVFARGVSGLARGTAGALQYYHKAAELLSVKARRSTADEADSLTQMTSVLIRCVSELATRFTQQLNKTAQGEDQSQVNEYTTNIFLEAGNSSRYIQNAFLLTLPVLQVGAI